MSHNRLRDLLAELDAEWHTQGAPIAHKAAPGLTEAQIDTLTAPVGLELPGELRTWWAWHNGLVADGTNYGFGYTFDHGSVGPGAWQLISLENAVERYRAESRTPQWPDDPIAGEFYWRDAWFPFVAASADVLFVDTTQVRPDGTAPVRFRAVENYRHWNVPQAPSVADMVTVWLRALREGHVRWDPSAHEQGLWVTGEPLPHDLRGPLTTG